MLKTFNSIKKQIPNVAWIVEKNSNQNVVVYEGKLFEGELYVDDPLDIYWMDIDPVQTKNRYRQELNLIEKQMAYGISCQSDSANPDRYIIEVKACRGRPILLYYNKTYEEVIAETKINKQPCQLQTIRVHLLNQVFVKYIELIGTNLKTFQIEVERVDHTM